MNHLKRLSLALVLSVALLSSVGAGAASADELYSTGVTVPAGTTLKGSIEWGSSVTLSTTDGSSIVDTCSGSSFQATVNTYTGGSVSANVFPWSWSGCTFLTQTVFNGSLSISWTGYVIAQGMQLTVNIGVSCSYATSLAPIGTLKTGKIAVNAILDEAFPKQFLCPDTVRWVANYVITSPHDLIVA